MKTETYAEKLRQAREDRQHLVKAFGELYLGSLHTHEALRAYQALAEALGTLEKHIDRYEERMELSASVAKQRDSEDGGHER